VVASSVVVGASVVAGAVVADGAVVAAGAAGEPHAASRMLSATATKPARFINCLFICTLLFFKPSNKLTVHNLRNHEQ
jgi:hypothetical protein